VAALVALDAVVVALLAVPIVLVIDAERVDTLRASWRVRWLFGLVDVRRARGGHTRPSTERPHAPKVTPARADPRRRGTRIGIAVLRTRGLLWRVARLVWDLGRRVQLQEFHARTVFGFEDPAETGVVYGFLSPLLMMAKRAGLDVDCHPMFLESGVRGTVRGTVRVRPLSVVGPLAAFLVSPAVLRSMRAAWRARR
jgi:hypothetical protein